METVCGNTHQDHSTTILPIIVLFCDSTVGELARQRKTAFTLRPLDKLLQLHCARSPHLQVILQWSNCPYSLEHYVNVGHVTEKIAPKRATLLELIPTRQLAMVNKITGRSTRLLAGFITSFPGTVCTYDLVQHCAHCIWRQMTSSSAESYGGSTVVRMNKCRKTEERMSIKAASSATRHHTLQQSLGDFLRLLQLPYFPIRIGLRMRS
jgi:hypothetical protein